MTLVIDPAAARIQTYWARLAVSTLEEAVESLAFREKIVPGKESSWIGVQSKVEMAATAAMEGKSVDFVDEKSPDKPAQDLIDAWLCDREDLDAVVWTALPSRANDGGIQRPTYGALLAHLKSLEGEARDRAEEYICRAPRSVKTEFRTQFEEDLGWRATELESVDPAREDEQMANPLDETKADRVTGPTKCR